MDKRQFEYQPKPSRSPQAAGLRAACFPEGEQWPHPYHGSEPKRRAIACFRSSSGSVDGAVMCSVAISSKRRHRDCHDPEPIQFLAELDRVSSRAG
jgi:hypothetical protein